MTRVQGDRPGRGGGRQPTVLLSFAHPDDEAFLAAGTAAKCIAEEGARVVLCTATRGEGATLRPGALYTREELGDAREAELLRAAEAIGISDVHLFAHPDRHLADADPEVVRGELVRAIRLHRPQVIITFDPNGSNLHPDHIAISRFTADAVSAAADPRWLPDGGEAHSVSRLLWTGAEPLWTQLREAPSPDALARRPGVDYLVDVRAHRARKREALLAHLSQRHGIDRLFFQPGDEELVLGFEVFRDAWRAGAPAKVRSGIFEDLVW